MKTELKHFFYPSSICIVGASSKEKSIGYEILKSIKIYNFTGNIFPVNPKTENILGFSCYKSILDIKQKIDLAIIVVPKKFVNESIDHLIEKKVKSIILITAGFKETGDEGEKLENELVVKLNKNGIRLVGPNCMGLINTLDSVKLNATFIAEKPKLGGTGFLSQSGALGAAVLNSLRDTDIKFSHFISVGNKADVSEIDILDFWLNDENIKTITFYLESFENGLKLIKRYNDASNKKPLIILKAGRTKAGMIAASSHTGALSSNEKIIEALLKQFGIIRVNNLNEMFNTAKGFENFPLPTGKRIAVVTNAGGPAILAVDNLEKRNLMLAQFSTITQQKLTEIVHPEGSINNPIDLLPGGSPEIYKSVIQIITEDENVDAVVSIFVEPVMVNAFDVIESVNAINAAKPIYQVCMPLPEFWSKYSNESKKSLPIFRNPEDPAEIISNILFYERKKNNEYNISVNNHSENSVKSHFLNQMEIKNICNSFKIPIVNEKVVQANMLENLESFSFPLVIKGLNKDVIHKSELDAVKLNIQNKSELFLAASDIQKSFSKNGFDVEEFLIQPFIKFKHELLVGGFRDPSFGPVIMFGTGGKYVEVLNDTKIKSAYLNENDINEMISETKIGKILSGVRREKSIDFDKLKSVIKSVAKMLIENNNILEIDLNPLTVDIFNELHAVDVRIKVSN